MLTEKHVIVEMTEPYVAGFLAFREVDHLLKCIEQLHEQDSRPQVCVWCVHCHFVYYIAHMGDNSKHQKCFGLME